MPIFICETCKKEFTIRRLYDNHLIRKNPCKLTNINQCINCEKSYSNRSNLNKHLKICKENIINDENQNQIEELRNMLLEQQKKIEELSQLTETNNNITVKCQI